MIRKIKKFFQKDLLLFYFIIFIIILSISFLFLYFIKIKIENGEQGEITDTYYFWTIAISLFVAIIALINLSSISKSAQGDFLLRVDERWGSEEIIKARQIIHRYYIAVKNRHKNDGIQNFNEEIGNEILKLHESTDHDDQKEFIYLLNFLDFMETIGYFCEHDFLELNLLKEFCALSIIFNYEIFKKVITHKREEQGECFYAEFEKLYKKLSCS